MIHNKSFTMSVVMLLVSMVITAKIYSRPAPVVVNTNLENIPTILSGYVATEDVFPEGVYRELNADKHVYRHYRNAVGKEVDLYIGYYGTAKGGRTGHNPYACLPGGGSSIIETGKANLKKGNGSETVPVNFILARKNGVNTIMLHWYQTSGSIIVSSGIKQNIMRFLGKIFRNRNDGAYVQVSASTPNSEINPTKLEVEKFAEIIMNQLPKYWPIER